MKTIDLIQGTPEWHAHRATHFNASDAPAMMGCGLKSRTELLAELHTAIKPDVSQYVQERVFDPGHRFEALARPLAEKIIGEDLYPVTGVNGEYSASFDGLTLMEDVAFEHKTLNDALRAAFDDMEIVQPEHGERFYNGRTLPLMYRVQMEHQALVSGCERILFMASEWDADDKLIAERHCWYKPDPELRAKIVAGWAQLAEDLKVYTPAPMAEPAPTGKAPETLPALRIEVTGAVTASNLAAFKETALSAIRSVNRDLKTDQDFADADASVKWCGDVESRLAAAKEHALSQTASIDALFKAIDDISAEARKVRLDLEKLVKARKDQIRMEIVSEAVAKGNEHMRTLNERIGKPLMPAVPADYAGVIKGKRSITSLRDAVDTELARVKIAANEIADRITLNLRAIEAAEHGHLFPDLAGLTLKNPDDLAAVIDQRVAKYKKDQDEAASKAAAVVQQASAAAQAPIAQAVTDAIVGGTGIARVDAGHVTRIDPAQIHDTGERIKLGDINARLAPIALTADGLAQLGFVHVATDKSAKLYRESDFPAICAALVKHITAVSSPAMA
ncbi:MAG: YqaJ viral recombinase family protein [Limnohabitans sp.]|uniref:YqaJ viral recombinase family protein n=1 Tax=Limnohabitans sp. TaxID=1907725 RepID=UPI003BB06134